MKIASILLVGLTSLFICKPGKTPVSPVLQASLACDSKFGGTDWALARNYSSTLQDIENFFAGNSTFGDAEPAGAIVRHNPGSNILRDKASAGHVPEGFRRVDIQTMRGGNARPNWKKQLAVYGYN